jgi:hypothetical protein
MRNSHLKSSNLAEHAPQPGNGRKVLAHFGNLPVSREDVLQEETFHAMLVHERRRAVRSRKHFVLMLLETRGALENGDGANFVRRLISVVSGATRETDWVGWYAAGRILAVIFTEFNQEEEIHITQFLHSKVVASLHANLGYKLASKLIVRAHLLPESWDNCRPDRMVDIKLYPDLPGETPTEATVVDLKARVLWGY